MYAYDTNFQKVRVFHACFFPTTPQSMDTREKLIDEEYKEFKEALGNFKKEPTHANEKELLKELCDLLFVAYGFGEGMNWDLDLAYQLVYKSNMSKLDDNGNPIYNADGKLMKGPNYKKPELGGLCKIQ